MKETYTFAPSPMVCSKRITLTVDGDVIESVEFLGGCPGNLAGISRLVKGRLIAEVAALLEGVHCGPKPTSCPDQLSCALKEILKKRKTPA